MIGSPARGAVRAVRVGLLGATSMTLATTAHLVGGGPLPPAGVLVVSGLLVGLVAVTATARRCRFGVLVALLAVEQVLLHWLFSAAAAMTGCDGAPLAAAHHGGALGAMGCAAGTGDGWVVRPSDGRTGDVAGALGRRARDGLVAGAWRGLAVADGGPGRQRGDGDTDRPPGSAPHGTASGRPIVRSADGAGFTGCPTRSARSREDHLGACRVVRRCASTPAPLSRPPRRRRRTLLTR